MKTHLNLGEQEWRVSGWTPYLWQLLKTVELAEAPEAEIAAVPATVPGSVQRALREAGMLPDWNVGTNWLACDWVENRQWMFETHLPDMVPSAGQRWVLRCDGLDYKGWVFVGQALAGEFCNGHLPVEFDLTSLITEPGMSLRIMFDLPPRWLGQFGRTSEMRDRKVRFNYTWDWQPRLVQVGIWDDISLDIESGPALSAVTVRTDWDADNGSGSLRVGLVSSGDASQAAIVRLLDGTRAVMDEQISIEAGNAALNWTGLPTRPWWPNGEGDRKLYTLRVDLLNEANEVCDMVERTVGFRRIEWRQCDGAPEGADPWLCVVNGRPVFLQGVNFPPIRPNYADLTRDHYAERLTTYAELGLNTLRVNGVGYLERSWFYELCDELGILVWQDLPLSSSGVENIPPDDAEQIEQLDTILRSYIARRGHHASLMLWCGGNELHRRDEAGNGVPLGEEHALLGRLAATVREIDQGRRFITTTATGPRFNAKQEDYGKGLHWNVHGPWKPWDDLTGWDEYWLHDDALFRAETGAPGCASADTIREFSGGLEPMPVSSHNSAWRRPLTWWVEAEQFAAELNREPLSLEEYVEWSQSRQARAIETLVSACKSRFPRCGGVLLWCGHDSFPCPANTSILDYHGQPKPAAIAVGEVWRRRPGAIGDERKNE